MLNLADSLVQTLMQMAHAWFASSDLRAGVILLAFALLFALEIWFGHSKVQAGISRQSYLANLGTFLLNDTLMSLMSVSALFAVAESYGDWGVLNLVEGSAARAVLSLLALDLALYAWHRMNHTFDSLWMFHKVHHSDPTMNVSTAFRLHVVEVVLTAMVKALFIVLMGVPSSVVLANESLITVMVMLHHANLRLPGERWLSALLIVPGLHRVHHSTQRREHDNNYGALLSVWDRLFGSFARLEPVKIGLESVPGMGVWQLLRYGVSAHWLPGLSAAQAKPVGLENMIAEAAYFRALQRGFEPGHESSDWLEAEQEIRSRMRKTQEKYDHPLFMLCCR